MDNDPAVMAKKIDAAAAWFVLDPVVPDSNTIMSNNKKADNGIDHFLFGESPCTL